MNILSYIYYYGFVCQVGFSNKKYIGAKKKKYPKKLGKSKSQVFMNNLQILPV